MQPRSHTAELTKAKARAAKLFALAKSSTFPAEREAAREKALAIVSAYQLDLSEFEPQARSVGPTVRAGYNGMNNPAWAGLRKSWVAQDPRAEVKKRGE